jgi:hypothetical protein
MTAALGHLTGSPLRVRGGRFLCVLALVLPVPLFATLGLSLPLPATVERIAAKLVPFADTDSLDASVSAGARGSITLAAGEARLTSAHAAPSVGAPAERTVRATRTPGAQLTAGGRPDIRTGEETTGKAPDATLGGGSEHSTSPSSPQQTASDPAPAPAAPQESTQSEGGSEPSAPPVVDNATDAASGAVESATNIVTDTANNAVDATTDAASGALGGINPP